MANSNSRKKKRVPKKSKFPVVTGTVVEALPNTSFRVEALIEDEKTLILAHLNGKMRMYRVRVLIGDKVEVELPTPDNERGRIIRRLRS